MSQWQKNHDRDKEVICQIEKECFKDVDKSGAEAGDGATDEILDCPGNDLESNYEVEVVYRRWIMGLEHFASIHVLEQVSGRLPLEAKINFSILGLNCPLVLPTSPYILPPNMTTTPSTQMTIDPFTPTLYTKLSQ